MHDSHVIEAIDRRRFLALIGGVAAATLAVACDGEADVESAALARPGVIDVLGAERVRDLGRRYREMTPSERDAESLRAAIRSSLPWRTRLSGSAPSSARLVHDDFDAGRTVVVSGWILSATEARQCALFSLESA